MSDQTTDVTQPWYMSKTIWSLIATFIVTTASNFGYKLDPAFANSLTDWLSNGAVLLGFILTAYAHHKSSKVTPKTLAMEK